MLQAQEPVMRPWRLVLAKAQARVLVQAKVQAPVKAQALAKAQVQAKAQVPVKELVKVPAWAKAWAKVWVRAWAKAWGKAWARAQEWAAPARLAEAVQATVRRLLIPIVRMAMANMRILKRVKPKTGATRPMSNEATERTFADADGSPLCPTLSALR